VLCNSADASPTSLVGEVTDIILAKDLKVSELNPVKEPAKAKGTTLTADQAAQLTGTYWNREDDEFIKIFMKDGKLQANFGDEEILILKPAGEERFHIADVPWGDNVEIRFVPGTSKKPSHLERSFGGGKPYILNLWHCSPRAAQSCLSM
jgi:hypothetical protein